MKKCLLISYYFPPRAGIGSQRPSKLAKYFPEFGWEPVIVTAKLPGKPQDGMRIIETDYKDIRASVKSSLKIDHTKGVHELLNIQVSKNYSHATWKSKIIKLAKDVIVFPDDQRGWCKYAMQAACELLDKETVDVILSTSSPVTSHIIANKLKKAYKIPWIADLRDLWTQNHYYDKSRLIKCFEKNLELRTLNVADALVTANPLVETLSQLHKNKNIFCVTNGYDDEEYSKKATKLTNKFTITYTGILYNGKRDPSSLFKVVAQLIDEKKIDKELIEISFIGCDDKWLKEEISKYKLIDVVKTCGYMPREEVLMIQQESQILLLLLWDNKDEKFIYPGKVFEYLGARRPIIAMGGPGGVVKELLDTTSSGKFAANETLLKAILSEYYREFITAGAVRCNSNCNAEYYTYKSITKKYSDILNAIVTK